LVNSIDGIRQIYPTKFNSGEWYLPQDPTGDGQFNILDGKDLMTAITDLVSRLLTQSGITNITNLLSQLNDINVRRNGDGSFSLTSDIAARINVTGPGGYNPSAQGMGANSDHAMIAERGFMCAPNDWKNVEMTGYLNVGGGNDIITWYARGGKHTSENHWCEGFAYKCQLEVQTGRVRFAKEQFHNDYVFADWVDANVGPITGKWVGFKSMIYNIDNDTKVKLEIWIDRDNNNVWRKVHEFTDAGGWGQHDDCGPRTNPDQIGTWGGPIATFRWDNLSNVRFIKLSVREIDTTALTVPSPTTGPSPTPAPGGAVDKFHLARDNGGRVMTEAHVQLLFWGASWNSSETTLKNQLISGVQKLIASDYFSQEAQYRGAASKLTYKGAAVNTTTSFSGVKAATYDFFTPIADALDKGLIETAQTDPHQYVLLFTPSSGVDFTGAGYLGFHAANLMLAPPESDLVWALITEIDGRNKPGFQNVPNATLFDSMMVTISHEIAEALCDPVYTIHDGKGGFTSQPRAFMTDPSVCKTMCQDNGYGDCTKDPGHICELADCCDPHIARLPNGVLVQG
jgi:hypothetical protein